MSRRTWLLAILLLVALVLIALARRDPPAQPERVTPPSAEAPAQPTPSVATEAVADPSERASIAEPAPKVAPGLTVSGTVRDAKSTLAGGTVSLWLEERSPGPLGKVVTGADGTFSFPVETDRGYLLACSARGYVDGGGEATPGKPVELYLASREATTELYGRVQEPDGKPVTSFTISVASESHRSSDTLYNSKPLESRTGEFRIQVGSRAKSSTLGVRASAPGFDSGVNIVKEVLEGTSTDVGAIVLKPLRAALEGIVEDALTGKPIAGARLEALCDPPGQQRDVESGADGTFQFSILPEQVLSSVSVWASGYAPRVIELGLVHGLLHVELGAGATIRGHVEFVGDAKSGDISVECWEQQGHNFGPEEPTHLRGIAHVDSDGDYELTHVAPVPLYIALYREVRADGRREIYHSQVQMVRPNEGQSSKVDFRTAAYASIRAHLLPKTRGLVVGRLLDASGTLVSTTDTLSGGDLAFRDVPPGHYEIRVCKVDVEHYLSRPVDVGREDLVLGDWDITAMPRKQ